LLPLPLLLLLAALAASNAAAVAAAAAGDCRLRTAVSDSAKACGASKTRSTFSSLPLTYITHAGGSAALVLPSPALLLLLVGVGIVARQLKSWP
jgi:hypothetical protein